MRATKTSLAAGLALAASLPLAAADVTIVYKTMQDGKPGTATEYVTTNKLRTSGERSDSILDTAAGLMITIDHEKKQYSEMSVAEVEAALQNANAQMATARQKQEEAMQNVPPAMRERMQKMMPGGMGGGALGAFKVVRGEGTRQVAGYDAQQFILTMGESYKSELWATTSLPLPLQPGELLRLQSMLSPMMKEAGKYAEEFKKIQGLTLASHTTIRMMGKSIESSREATEIKLGPIDPSQFAVPAGYAKVPSPLTRMGAPSRK